jgi:NAD(P)-dependent dehydrogenase (short-subunit alcohol dehydrogenase family)
MTITFITGANKGLGYETARRLIAQGHTVLVGARDATAGTAAATELGARFVPIDVTDDESVTAAAADVEKHEGTIDVLINNAGVAGPHGDPSTLTGADIMNVLNVNVAGVADPGYTATDLNGNTGPQTVTEGTDAVVGLATEGPGHPSGRFVDRAGEIAWS